MEDSIFLIKKSTLKDFVFFKKKIEYRNRYNNLPCDPGYIDLKSIVIIKGIFGKKHVWLNLRYMRSFSYKSQMIYPCTYIQKHFKVLDFGQFTPQDDFNFVVYPAFDTMYDFFYFILFWKQEKDAIYYNLVSINSCTTFESNPTRPKIGTRL